MNLTSFEDVIDFAIKREKEAAPTTKTIINIKAGLKTFFFLTTLFFFFFNDLTIILLSK